MASLINPLLKYRPVFAAGSALLAYGSAKGVSSLAQTVAARIFTNGAPAVLTRIFSNRLIQLLPAAPFAYMTLLATVHMLATEWEDDQYEMRYGEENDIRDVYILGNMPLIEKLDRAFDEGGEAELLPLLFKSRPLFALGSALLSCACVKAASGLAHFIASSLFANGTPVALTHIFSNRIVQLLPAAPFAYVTALATIHIATTVVEKQDQKDVYVPTSWSNKWAKQIGSLPFFITLHRAFTDALPMRS